MQHACLAAAALLLAVPGLRAAGVDYARDVKPILAARCFACHGAVRQKAGLRLDAARLIRKGGRHGPAVVPGKGDASLLVEAVRGVDRPRMPPESEGEALPDRDVATLKAWVDQGARAPDEPVPADPRGHWAFRPPVAPPVPRPGAPTPTPSMPSSPPNAAGTGLPRTRRPTGRRSCGVCTWT
jgi:hypothetical protein